MIILISFFSKIYNMKKIALVGGGPAALFMYKRLVESAPSKVEVHIFEQHDKLGAGMPYSHYGSSEEHITNVSDNEIPEIKTPIKDWITIAPEEVLKKFDMKDSEFNEYKVLPRLLFGEYLSAQFNLLISEAKKIKLKTIIHLKTKVTDISHVEKKQQIKITTTSENFLMDMAVICTGHSWPCKTEKKIKTWFDSPYPPQKFAQQINFAVAIRGASLTAIDAVRTLAHANGQFSKNEDGTYTYSLHEKSKGFKLVLHSLDGLLPALRFHLKDTHLMPAHVLSESEIIEIKKKNNGFVPLDYVYDLNFKNVLRKEQPELFKQVKDMSIEGFITYMLTQRKKINAFTLLAAEYREAEKSIKKHESVIWKETLAELSYAMNYPAKHFSAEDMLRLKKIMMPLISVIIAFVPQSSARELMALHEKELLDIIPVDSGSSVTPGDEGGCIYTYKDENGLEISTHYKMFIDAMGQKPFLYNEIPFEGLKNKETLSAAYLRFAAAEAAQYEIDNGNELVMQENSGDYFLQVPGININDFFQALDIYGVANPRLFIMAVPYIAGVNPDYSGLDFCEAASEKIIQKMNESFIHDNITLETKA